MAWMPLLRLKIAPPPPPPLSSSQKPILLFPPPPLPPCRCRCFPPITTTSNHLLQTSFNLTKPPAAALFSNLRSKLKPPPPEVLVDVAKFYADPRLLIPYLFECTLSFVVVPAVYHSRYPTVPFETTVWGALAHPLACVVATAITWLLRPSRACPQSDAFVLPLLWFLYNWKTNFIRKTLDMMRAKGSHPDDIALVEKFSTFCTNYLYGMVLSHIFSSALVYFLLSLVFIGVPFLYSDWNTIVSLLYSRFEQTGPNSFIDVSTNEDCGPQRRKKLHKGGSAVRSSLTKQKRKKSESPGTGSGVGQTLDGSL